jgi:hypothetical protein
VTSADYAALAAQVLRRRGAEPRGRPAPLARDVGIGVVAQAIATRQRRRRARLTVGGAVSLAVAASAALAIGWYGAHGASRSPVADGSPCRSGSHCAKSVAPADDVGDIEGRPFAPGQFLVARSGQRDVVEFATGTRISLEQGAALEYRHGADSWRFGLERGSVRLHVAKLAHDERLVVETPDAEVEVRGTVFDVSVLDERAACAGSRTRVSVEQGIVEVRWAGELHRLTAGQSWPTPCPEPGLAVAESDAPTTRAALRRTPPRMPVSVSSASEAADGAATPMPRTAGDAEPTAPRVPSESVVSTVLAEQNDLFGRASQAQRQGRSAAALAHYDRLLARFPTGPLTEAALVERLRVLRRTDSARARSEARAYLGRYPGGFARGEAQAILRRP